jgi:uncharacterized protein
MKYLLLLGLLLALVGIWRQQRRSNAPTHTRRTATAETVACAVCQVHVPRAEALLGRNTAFYCSEAHRQQA